MAFRVVSRMEFGLLGLAASYTSADSFMVIEAGWMGLHF